MIGEKVVLRVRMSAGDAHYAGELVNGSKILDFFGDVATELCIRFDGDESLFKAYDSVEFMAPVYAGDFMEYHGWIESVGNTSRKMMIRFKHFYLFIQTDMGVFPDNAVNLDDLLPHITGIAR